MRSVSAWRSVDGEARGAARSCERQLKKSFRDETCGRKHPVGTSRHSLICNEVPTLLVQRGCLCDGLKQGGPSLPGFFFFFASFRVAHAHRPSNAIRPAPVKTLNTAYVTSPFDASATVGSPERHRR